jgi:integrase
MAKTHLKLVPPSTKKRTVALRRRPNAELRTREHLTEAEVERLMKAAGKNRWGHRDATMILVAYRHGLRASELVDLRWDQVDFRTGNIHVRRVKQGTPSMQSYKLSDVSYLFFQWCGREDSNLHGLPR